MGLEINENKTTYMPCTKSCFINSHFKNEEYSFEVVDSFICLGSENNNRNDCTTEIRKRITMANTCLIAIRRSGHGSRMVKVSDCGWCCHEFESSTTKDPPFRGAMHVKPIESSKSSRWCGVVARRGDASSGVIHVT
ncbi:hypothetical protein TNCV_1266611 [Trichonephila clavipes]|nr:hypothetical protein TNCV_1266611 [Trichonephila clavipes]